VKKDVELQTKSKYIYMKGCYKGFIYSLPTQHHLFLGEIDVWSRGLSKTIVGNDDTFLSGSKPLYV